MKYICIMGNNDEYTKTITKKLIKLGYHDNNMWSTRKTNLAEVLSEENFIEALSTNRMIQLEQKDDIRYGVLKPVGHRKYITHTSTTQFDKLREIYKEQVVGLYISYANSTEVEISKSDAYVLKKHTCGIIICNKDSDTNNIVAEILRLIKD